MRFKSILFICVIVLCAAGANICQAGWVGECKYSGASIFCSCPSEGLSDPYTYYAYPPDGLPDCWGMTQEEMDAQCETDCTACQSVSCGGGAASVSVVMDGVDDLSIPVFRATATGEGIIERGFQWRVPGGSSSGPLPADNGAEGSFSMSVQLFASTTFYISAYVKYDGTNYAYSEEYEFTTGSGTAPTVNTLPDVTVNGGEALLNGEITDIGSSTVFSYGFIHEMHPNLTFSDTKLTFTEQTDTGKTFQGTLTDLFPGKYYFRAYADNSHIAGYGEEHSFIISGNIDESDKYAWSENTGWLNFNSMGGINVFADHLEGYVWHEAIGWIKIGGFHGEPHTYGNTPATDFGVNNDGYGNLSGFAWSENAGWINFRTAGRGVTIDPDGNFNGYAWGEAIGWIHFGNVSSVYNVATAWRSGATPYSLTILTDGQGYGTADIAEGAASYVKGQPVNLRAVPSSRSVFAGWSPEPCAESFDMPESDLICTATFDRKSYNLTVEKSGMGEGTVSGGGSFAYGKVISVTATPDENSEVSGWDPPECEGRFAMPPSDMTCTAIFKPKTYTVHVNTTGGSGTEKVSGTGEYLPGDRVQLSPPNRYVSDSIVMAWYPDWCREEFIMPNSDVTCTAEFAKLYVFTVGTSLGEGSGHGYSWYEGFWTPGTKLFIAQEPARDSVFAGWSPAPCAGEFTMPASDLTCTATFNLKPSHTLTVKKDGTGSGTVKGGGTYVETRPVPLEALPDAGSAFTGWYPGECETGMEMPTSDLTCTATFTKTVSLTIKGTPGDPTRVKEKIDLLPGRTYTLPDYSGTDFYVKRWSPSPCAEEFTVPTSDLTCTAEYGKTYKLTVKGSPEDPEEIVSSESDIIPGKSVSLPDKSDSDFYFKRWSPAPCAEEFTMPASDLTCTAEYGRYRTLSVDYEVSGEAYDSNNVYVSGGGKYIAGELVTPEVIGRYNPVPKSRLEVVKWEPSMCSGTFIMPDADVSCTATLEEAYWAEIVVYKPFGAKYKGKLAEQSEARFYLPGELVDFYAAPAKGCYIENYTIPSPFECLKTFPMPRSYQQCRVGVGINMVLRCDYSLIIGEVCFFKPEVDPDELRQVSSNDFLDKSRQVVVNDFLDNAGLVAKNAAKKREGEDVYAEDVYAIGESLFITSQSNENGIAAIEFRRPVYAVLLNISDYSGDTEVTAYNADGAVVKSIPVRGETLQEYIVGDAEGILRIVISSSDAYLDKAVQYALDGFIGDVNFDDSRDLTDAILVLQEISAIEHPVILYPALSINEKISLADAIYCLQTSAGSDE